jgi:hypothetical protein
MRYQIEPLMGPVKILRFCFTPMCEDGPERKRVQDGMMLPV